MAVYHIVSINTLADLKATPGEVENVVITLGKTNKGDNLGALYYWDSASQEADDIVYNNTVAVTGIITGRWKRVFTRMMNLPHGVLVINAGKKEFYYSGIVASGGTCTVNLTMDGTATGVAIFTDVWFDDSKATINASKPSEAVTSYRKELTTNLKQLTHGFVKGNETLVTLLNTNVISFANAAVNTPVKFKIEGI